MENLQFDFDSDENISVTKTPAVKALTAARDEDYIGGIWIAHENADVCKWKKSCPDPDNCLDCTHFKNTTPHKIATTTPNPSKPSQFIFIKGCLIENPRIIILQRSHLLKAEKKNGMLSIVRKWRKEDGQDKERKCFCIRRYLILFLDEDNNPLHEVPLQLTAKGCFQFEFDKKLEEFRQLMLKAYNESTGKHATNMNALWYGMCVFCPTLESEIRGRAPNQSRACITTAFKKPTRADWESLCIGRRKDLANLFWSDAQAVRYPEHICTLYNDTKKRCEDKGWWRETEKLSPTRSSSEDEHPEDVTVKYVREDRSN